jgi:peptidyl-prolyl cis-trans isomerase SurA
MTTRFKHLIFYLLLLMASQAMAASTADQDTIDKLNQLSQQDGETEEAVEAAPSPTDQQEEGFFDSFMADEAESEPVDVREQQIKLDRIIVLVEEDLVTERELEKRVAEVKRRLAGQDVNLPSEKNIQRQVLDRLILDQIQLQMAKLIGIRIDDITLDRQMADLAKANGMSLPDFREQILAEGLNYPSFREDIRKELSISLLRKRQVDSQVTVTDQEVDDLIASQSEFLNKDVEFRLRHILISIPEDATPEQVKTAREKANTLLENIRAGEDFAELAISQSDGQQALNGGDLGWRPLAELPNVFIRSTTLMEPGQVSDVIRSPSGFHIIKVVDKRGGKQALIEKTLARHILIKTNALVSDTEAEARLASLKRRIEGGDSFSTLARAYSEDKGSAIEGGNLGWSTPGAFVPAFEETMNNLEVGQISEPFKSQFGWHIIEVMDRRKEDSTLKVLKNRARELISERKREEELRLWLRRIRDEAYVEYLDERYKPDGEG